MKKIILAVAVAAIASMAVVSSASAGVERYQMQTMTITAIQPEDEYGQWTNVWTHTYNVTLNPCDGSFSGVGSQVGDARRLLWHPDSHGPPRREHRQLHGNALRRHQVGDDRPIGDTLIATVWNADGTVIETTEDAIEFKVSKTTPNASTNYKNHGEYVKAMGGGADAAHSCIGMPIH